MATSAIDLYSPGTRVWLPDAAAVWVGATVDRLDVDAHSLRVTTETGETRELDVGEDNSKLPFLRNPDVLVGVNDLTDLSYLHEPAVVHNVRVRFSEQHSIYTYCGIVLVAVNPYESLPLYTSDILRLYAGKTAGELDPHIFAVAEDAFACLRRTSRCQSIIVSGESGAGKTVSAKYAMRYFATVGGAEAETQIERKVLASNPVMESIGNAKTTRNDNSSRFGKYIEIIFNTYDHIIGAEMRTYLLEKSRVVFQATTERNYHIFYQLCACADHPELEALELSEAEEFFYTKQGGDSEIPNVDDAADFTSTKEALSLLGVSDDNQLKIFAILGALLHMGNIEIKQRSRRNEDSTIDEDDTHLPVAARLLGVDQAMLSKWMTNRKITTGREVFTKPQTTENAIRARDALAKHIYSHIFDWVVTRINESLAPNAKATKQKRFIGVLDIYGFETFKVNSFEQFCINYANEKLQQQFNQHVFKLEQDEYVREEIQWSFIDFYDNQPCIDLIESRMGILALLDEETKLPKGSDENWLLKMHDRLTESEHYEKPRLSSTAFVVKHYADKVAYEVASFMEKNKDTIFEEHLIMLRGSSVDLVADLFREGKVGGKDGNKATVGTQFQKSLTSLMDTLNDTEPHYVRCIKPNDTKEAFGYDSGRVVQQLRACGVLETIRISAAGYPSRWSYPDFLSRYRLLRAPGVKLDTSDVRSACQAVLGPIITDEDKYQLGKTKIFFRAGQVAYLEKLRSDTLRRSMVRIQSHVRAFLQRQKYERLRAAAIALQQYARGLLARQLAKAKRETAAAKRIQAAVRGWVARRRYLRTCRAIQTMQRFARGMHGRREFRARKRVYCATLLQASFRMWQARKAFLKTRAAIVVLQCGVRRVNARRALKKLKTEARSVEGIRARNTGLEKKIMELQQTMDRRVKAAQEQQAARLAELEGQLNKAHSQGSEQVQASAGELARLQEENGRLTAALQEAQDGRTAAEAAATATAAELEETRSRLQAQLTKADDTAAQASKELEGAQAKAARLPDLEQHLAQLQSELSDERVARQQKIRAQMEKEERIAELETRLQSMEMQVLHGAASDTVSTSSIDAALPGSGSGSEESDILRATVAALKAQLATAKRELAVAAASRTSRTSGDAVTATATAADSSLVSSATNDGETAPGLAEDASSASRAAVAEEEVFELRERLAVLNQEVLELRAENRELLVAGQTAPAPPSTVAVAGAAQSVDTTKTDAMSEDNAATNVAPVADTSPTSPTSLGDDDNVEALEQGLLRARTDIARLQLANTKLMTKLQTLEKANVAAEAKLKRLGGDNGTESLRANLLRLREQVETLRSERETLVPVADLESARGALQAAEVRLAALQDDYDAFMNKHCMLDLAKAKTDLQQRNHALQEETQSLRARIVDHAADLKAAQAEIGELKTERRNTQEHMDKLKQALARKLPGPGSSGSNAGDGTLLQEEVRTLINENLGMRERLEELEGKVAELEAALVAARQGGGGARATGAHINTQKSASNGGAGGVGEGGSSTGAAPDGSSTAVAAEAAVRYHGMLKFREKDIQRVVSALVLRQGPTTVPRALPGLAAHLLFMCVLYADHVENAAMLQGLLTKSMTAIKQVVMQHAADLDMLAFWLANGYRLLSNMKQFSGEPQFKTRDDELSPTLTTFDLQEYRIVLSDLLVQIYHTVLKHVEVHLTPMIVPGMLDFESLPGAGGAAAAAGRRTTPADGKPAAKVDDVVRLLTNVLSALQRQCLEPRLVQQVFRQLYYIVNAVMVNNLLLRKDLARLTKGMQVRYSISKLQDWARDNSLEQIGGALTEAVQITQLLQCNKTKAEDVDTIFATCVNLNPLQIQKVLTMYTPEEFETRVPAALLRAVHDREKEAKGGGDGAKLLMDASFMYPVTFPFTPSSPKFPTLELPAEVELDFVEKL